MYYYRITKYDPKLRDKAGQYTQDEWTDFSCVEKKINGKMCTLEEYEVVEQMYVDAVMQFLLCENIDFLECCNVEKVLTAKIKKHMAPLLRNTYDRVDSGAIIYKTELPTLLRLVLRNYLWCKLKHSDNFFAHFGYDFYMYVGLKQECAHVVEQIDKSGLFVENYISPYLDDE